MHLQAEAGALEAEAATWELLLHMYANTHKVYPAGTGGQQTAIKTVCPQCLLGMHTQVSQLAKGLSCASSCSCVLHWHDVLVLNAVGHASFSGITIAVPLHSGCNCCKCLQIFVSVYGCLSTSRLVDTRGNLIKSNIQPK